MGDADQRNAQVSDKLKCRACGREHESVSDSGRLVVVGANGLCGGCWCAKHGWRRVQCPDCALERTETERKLRNGQDRG